MNLAQIARVVETLLYPVERYASTLIVLADLVVLRPSAASASRSSNGHGSSILTIKFDASVLLQSRGTFNPTAGGIRI